MAIKESGAWEEGEAGGRARGDELTMEVGTNTVVRKSTTSILAAH